MTFRWALGTLALSVCVLVACGPHSPAKLRPGDPALGVYRVTLDDSGRKPRRFRMLLWAAEPDRLHGEILSPVGSTVAIVDGGSGQLAVTVLRDHSAFVGPATPESLEQLLGVRIELADLVAALLGRSSVDPSYRLERVGEPGKLPEQVQISDDTRSVLLELRKLRPMRGDPRLLGTAEVAPGIERYPLERLDLYDVVDSEDPT